MIKDPFSHPILPRLADMHGFAPLPSQPGGVALDFIRGNLFDRSEMRLLPYNVPGPDNDLGDRIDYYIKRAISDSRARVFAFGQRWGPEQGQRGVWQDGGLILQFPASNQWRRAFSRLPVPGVAYRRCIPDMPSNWRSSRAEPCGLIAAMVNPVAGGNSGTTVILASSPTPRGISTLPAGASPTSRNASALSGGRLPAGRRVRIANLKDWLPIQRTEDYIRWSDGLRKAGLPEVRLREAMERYAGVFDPS